MKYRTKRRHSSTCLTNSSPQFSTTLFFEGQPPGGHPLGLPVGTYAPFLAIFGFSGHPQGGHPLGFPVGTYGPLLTDPFFGGLPLGFPVAIFGFLPLDGALADPFNMERVLSSVLTLLKIKSIKTVNFPYLFSRHFLLALGISLLLQLPPTKCFLRKN